MRPIRVEDPTIDGGRVEHELSIPRRLRGFFEADSFWVEFDSEAVGEACPPGILLVPPLVSIAPLAWASGTTVEVREVGRTFLESLDRLQSALERMYPAVFTEDVEPLLYDETVEYDTSTSGSSMLFSGGVDSLACYVEHRHEEPALFTVHGSDVDLDNETAWESVHEQVDSFADPRGLTVHRIRSNFRALRYGLVNACLTSGIDRGWWGSVHFGTALPALCAPVAYHRGYEVVYEASGYTADPTRPNAQPSFVDEIAWDGTRVEMTEVDQSRQDKIGVIADYLAGTSEPLTVRSCYSDERGENCSECSKCRRTIIGLIVEGVDPNTVGYHVDGSTLADTRRAFEEGELRLHLPNKVFWEEIRDELDGEGDREYLHDDVGFFDWLRSVDLDQFVTEGEGRVEQLGYTAGRVLFEVPYPLDVWLWDAGRTSVERLRPARSR